jgi:hypothetical protein
MRDGQRARARAAAEQRAQEKKTRELRQARLLSEARAALATGLCKCARDAEIRHLVAGGCVLEDIGSVYGITRERARQIAAGLRVAPYCEPGHDYASAPCRHGIITPARPETARRRPRQRALSSPAGERKARS